MPDVLTSLALIPAVGIGAQWIAWRLGLPSILVLLSAGLLMGAGFGILDPDELFGDLLDPAIDLAVGLILFEGGLSLSRRELRAGRNVVPRLLAIGIVVTACAATFLAVHLLDLPLSVAAVIGALLVVTGPTVVGPLLSTIRPRGAVGPILKTEGILVDPIGAVLGALVFQIALSHEVEGAVVDVVTGLLRFAAIGVAVGVAGAALATFLLRRYLIPDGLVTAFALALALVVIASADELMDTSGLLAVTIMGIAIGGQQRSEVRNLLEFNEAIRVLLIASLFTVLGAQVTRAQLESLGWEEVVFVLILIVVVRPVVATLATVGTELTWRERCLLGWMAPRGIVAASTASVFALELQEANITGSDSVVPVVFLTIFITIAVYGLTAGRISRAVGLSDPNPQGLLILGANPLAVAVGKAVQQEGFRVLLNDRDAGNVHLAREAGLEVFEGNVLSDLALEELDLRGIGRMLAMTEDAALTALAAMRFGPLFGRRDVFQLPPDNAADEGEALARELRARLLFGPDLGYRELSQRLERGARIVRESGAEAVGATADAHRVALFVVKPDHHLVVGADDRRLLPSPADTVLSLVGG
jgi:NhaP-type Na+/H+ or K+/H+ antiporter